MTLHAELHGQELVAVKEGGSAEELRREAALLGDLDHPGIIDFVALTEDERGPRLLTRYAGRETLATWQPQRVEELRRVIEEVSEAVCHLHERGIVHGAIRPAHIVIDPLRRPLLCGFSSARSAGHDDAEHLADVQAVGETALATLARLESQWPRPGLRRSEQRLRRRLQVVAQAAGVGRVPSSRALASRLRAVATEPHTTRSARDGREDRPRERSAALRPWLRTRHVRRAPRRIPRRRRAGWLAAAAVCAGCAAGALMILRVADQNAATPAPAASASPDSRPSSALLQTGVAQTGVAQTGTGAPPGVTPSGVNSSGTGAATRPDAVPEPRRGAERRSGPLETPADATAGCREPASGLRDVDGDGCAEQIRIDAGFVSVDEVRYPVGAAGDQLAVGDWDCDGIATVALVEPTGRVYVFETWPHQAPLVGTLVVELPPPVELAEVARGACSELTVRYSEGTWFLPLPAGPGWPDS